MSNNLANSLLQQKAERDSLASRQFVPRTGLKEALRFLETPLAKVIVGPRRAGKSVFAHLLLRGSNYAYVNFDDAALQALKSHAELETAVNEVYGDYKIVFLDEVQNLDRWELFVNSLLRRERNVIITGSNAHLLSGELADALTGRHLVYEVFPFSFIEYLSAKGVDNRLEGITPENKGIVLHELGRYLIDGGYPEVTMHGIDPGSYLSTLLDSILLKDIVRRYGIRYPRILGETANYLISNVTAEYTFNSLKKNLGFSSVATVAKYFSYLEESYLFFSLNRFSFKLKEQLRAPKKAYVVDNGFYAAKAFRFSPDNGRLLENAVFVELVRSGVNPATELFYFRTRTNKEVDFMLRKGAELTSLIQVCFDPSDKKTLKRELKALSEASVETGIKDLKVITWDYTGEETIDGKTVNLIPFRDFCSK